MLWQEKIVTLEQLQQKIQHWKAVGGRVVFTNGCFDILHQGHVQLLSECATFGDYVIVGLNSDASVKRLKGEKRPINSEQSRVLLLAALQWVDAVIIFEEDTPLALIESIEPNVLVKGGDYQVHQVVGASSVMDGGGEVRIVPTVEGFSTTAILSKNG